MGENNDFRNFHDRQNGPDFKDRPTNGGSIRRRLQRNFNIDVQDDPFNDISFTRPASYNLENLNQNNQRQQNEEYPSLPNLTRQEVDDPYSYSTRRVSENDIATQGYSTLPVRRRNRNQHSTNTEHANEELAENILESFMDAQNEGVISMSSIRDRAIRRKKRQVNNRDSKAEMENFWSNIGSNSKDENKTDFLPHVVSRGRKKSITINSEEYFFSDENESSSNELELTGTKPPNRNLDNAQDDEHPHASVVKRRKKTPPENRLSADISFWDNIPSNDRVNESVISNQNTTDQSCDITLTNENQEVLSSTNQNTDVPSNGITLTNQHQELQSRGASLSNENPPVEDTTFSELASQLLGEPEIQVFGDSETILQHKQTDFGQTETTGNLLSPTKETENSGTTKRTFLSSVSHDIQPPSPRRRSSTNTGVANGTTQKGNRNSTVEMEEFWNEVAMRSQSQENLIESSSSDKETTVQSNQLCTDHLKVDDTASNKSPRVQRRSPAVIRRKKRNTEYRNSQAAMDDFWNAIVVHDDQDDSMSDEDGEENEEDDVVRRERPCSFLSVESKGRSSNRNSRGDMEEYWSHVVKESEQQKQEGGEQQQEEDAHGGGERVTSVKSRAQESSDEEIEESPIIKLRRRRKSRIDYRNSRADLEDFWNEITTTENEEKIEDEKSFDIDVDVKEKQQEIESAIKDAKVTKVSSKLLQPAPLLEDSTVVLRNKMKNEFNSNRNSRADFEDFWNEITATENEEKNEDEKSFDIDVDVKEKQQEIENAIGEVLSPKQSTIQPLELTDNAVIKRRKKKDFDSNRNFGDCPLDEITKSTKDIDTRLVQHESEAAIESRADLEDFWNEITTTENEEKIKDEKSFDIDVDVKEKQHEIESAIEDATSPMFKLFPPLLDTEREETFYRADVDDVEQQAQVSLLDVSGENSIIRRKKKKDANESQRNSRAEVENFWNEIANDGKPTVDNDAPSQPKVIIVDSLDDNSLGLPSRRRPSELRNSQAEIEKFWTEARIRTAAEKLESEETMTVVKRRASEGDMLRDDVRNSRADLEDFWNEITTTENEENIENEKSFDIDVDVKEKQQNVDVEPPQDKSLLDVPVRRRRSDFRNSDADIERFWTEAHIRTAAEKLATEETAVIKRNKTKEDAGESKNDRGKIRNSRLLDEDFWSSFDFENIEEAERKFKDIENDNNKVSPKQSQKQSVGKLKDDIPLESDGDGESSLDESPTNSYMQRWDDDDNSQ
uniref:Uncharacterized protein n=1 Tax=Clytia hemisphaerica TaxID=252671 RepID=A0A7M5V0A4_9CNID